MDAAALRELIESGPPADELAPLVKDGRDGDVAARLNLKDQPGDVPRRHVVACLAEFPQVDGLIRWVLRFGKMPPVMGGADVDFGLFCLFSAITRVADSDVDLRAPAATLAGGLAQVKPLVDAGAVPKEFGPALLAGEVKLSVIEAAFGVGAVVSPTDVGNARNMEV